jgi:Transglutaminase-like superfamily
VKKRSGILLVVLLFVIVIAGAAEVLAGGIRQSLPEGQASISGSSLPVLLSSPIPGGLADETSERIAESADYQDPAVKNFVASHTHISGGANTIAQLSDLWEAIHANWTYTGNPTDTNEFHPAGETIGNGLKGNCLDYAILNAAIIESLGGTARVVSAYNPQGEGHAYAEVYAGDSVSGIMAVNAYIASRYHATALYLHTTAGPGNTTEYWLNLDWQAPYPGGPFFGDNGTYYASFLTGTGIRYEDNGNPVPSSG